MIIAQIISILVAILRALPALERLVTAVMSEYHLQDANRKKILVAQNAMAKRAAVDDAFKQLQQRADAEAKPHGDTPVAP